MLIRKVAIVFGLVVGFAGFSIAEAKAHCCAAQTRGNPGACQACCNQKWGPKHPRKHERCLANCQRGTCR